MKNLALPITLVTLIITGTAGFYYFQQSNQPTTTPVSTEVETTSQVEQEVDLKPLLDPEGSPAPTQTIQDSAGLYSLELPTDWQVTLEDARGVRLSGLMAQSPDFLAHIDDEIEGPTAMVYYTAGASLQVTVTGEPLSSNPYPAGLISEQAPITVGGIRGTLFTFKEPSTAEGSLMDFRMEKDARSYSFRWSFNEETLPQGKALFERILSSVRFL